jgi:hypothetical protein
LRGIIEDKVIKKSFLNFQLDVGAIIPINQPGVMVMPVVPVVPAFNVVQPMPMYTGQPYPGMQQQQQEVVYPNQPMPMAQPAMPAKIY